jgi:hypothetical protein
MQKSTFPNGGFVLHRYTNPGYFKGRISAWFDSNGTPLEAEILHNERSRPVKKGGPIWQDLVILGRIWR